MRSSWKIAAPVAVAAICGAVIFWQVQKAKANQQKLAETARVCRVSAAHGDAEAEASLAYMYSHGQGVPRDYDEAARWYRKAADQGNARGETGTGYMYYTGEGVLQDFAEAARWYRKAADQGYAKGEHDLADLYYNGYGLPLDYTEAANWYRRAADHGDASAQYELGWMYQYGKGVQQDRAAADQWFHKAAENGDDNARRFLGMKGRGLNTWGKVALVLMFLPSLFYATGYLKPGSRIRDQGLLVGAMLGLSYVGLSLMGAYSGVLGGPLYVAILFRSVKNLVSGMAVSTLISVGWRQGAKVNLVLSFVLFAGVNLTLGIPLYRNAYNVSGHSVFGLPAFYGMEALPIGIAIPAIILLWQSSKNGSDDTHLDSGLAASELPAENGLGV